VKLKVEELRKIYRDENEIENVSEIWNVNVVFLKRRES